MLRTTVRMSSTKMAAINPEEVMTQFRFNSAEVSAWEVLLIHSSGCAYAEPKASAQGSRIVTVCAELLDFQQLRSKTGKSLPRKSSAVSISAN